ncbi:orotidine-5'-phosphate decarboxylase [Rubrivirga sp.]|uniref:orotidine-5'-phosphate decarboxylase n=1 Tax=Rubrivirga sp. TaxID=1885344 RepID=UPI003C72F0FD
MTSFASRLDAAVLEVGSPLCVGLDPDLDRLPSHLKGAKGVVEFCIAITESCASLAAAFKPNLAFFEALGRDGWYVLEDVCAAVRSTGRLLVLDGKRGDIGNTGRKYAASQFDVLEGDAATVAPYMGSDSLLPFLEHRGRCAFALVATSNPGGADLQQLEVDSEPLYHRTANLAARSGEHAQGEIGFVVGATRPDVLSSLRARHPAVPFLVPGVGAQGGSLDEVMVANANGPILINSSRSIIYASTGADFAEAAARAAQTLSSAIAKASV